MSDSLGDISEKARTKASLHIVMSCDSKASGSSSCGTAKSASCSNMSWGQGYHQQGHVGVRTRRRVPIVIIVAAETECTGLRRFVRFCSATSGSFWLWSTASSSSSLRAAGISPQRPRIRTARRLRPFGAIGGPTRRRSDVIRLVSSQ